MQGVVVTLSVRPHTIHGQKKACLGYRGEATEGAEEANFSH